MEHIIDRLVRDFEQGKLSRRQLIQGLTVAASATVTASATPADPAPFKAVTVNHISYQVADYKKTRDFYAGLLGMEVSHDDDRQCYLSFGNTFLLPRNVRQGRTAPLVDHIAYTIETWNKDAVEAELKKRGLPVRPDTENSFHTKDPDGFDVQISGKEMKA
jgi:catechol 2,3-dioxygenase-like lactoylglutathione lyase family enzyme